MKKLSWPLLALFTMLGTAAVAQNTAEADAKQKQKNEEMMKQDWACLKCFSDDNAKVEAPKAGEQRVVFMGNSITIGWSHLNPDFFAGKPYINRGISGQTTPQMLIRFRPDVIDLHPKVVVILAGTNDIAGNTGYTPIPTIFGNIVSMAELASANGIKVVLSSVLPVFDYPWHKGLDPVGKIADLNQRIKAYADKNGFVYLDYYTAMADEQKGLKSTLTYDGVHPNKEGYQVMGPLAEKAIAAALKKK
ncbi:SGNH/GDSL hydrolase family protein [Chitinophaga sp. 22321]|uniref:SGNH/GDSL hydrolase family protein n=1 Tax=Chitinophaga hostae TaxID=2831022 RepID=A0ABS5J3Q9_9BACT|nr:SGNH/GDSL hydrolase family protein [Chitinophaga hostae]MBS0029861.1 SGNH/GDSL hydrolase family protein [Chitinophaga hostae]